MRARSDNAAAVPYRRIREIICILTTMAQMEYGLAQG
jgi:hypothetical protein